MKEVKIIGTNRYMDVECNGNIARFEGELGISSFYAYENPITWIRHKGFATDESKMKIIREVQKMCLKEPVFFVDNEGEISCRTRPEIGKSRNESVKFDILNIEKGKMDIELDGKTVQFGGEIWDYGFTVNIGKMEWLSPEERLATCEEARTFIKELKKLYRKEPRENRRRFQLRFYEMRHGKWCKAR